MKNQKYVVYFLLTFVMASWGLNVSATKIMVMTFSPVMITAFRLLSAGICLFLILLVLKKIRIPTKQEFYYIFFGGLFNIVGHHYFLSVGLKLTSASNTGLILGLGPLLTTILVFLILRQVPNVFRIIGVILGLIGVSFIVLNGNEGMNSSTLGDLSIFISVIFQAYSFIIIKKATTLEPLLLTSYMLLIGSVLLFLISLGLEPDGITTLFNGSLSIWFIFLASAIVASAIGQTIYNYAVSKVGVVESSIFMNLTPFFSLVGAAFIIGETITLTHIIGFILILFGVLLGSGAWEEILLNRKRKKYAKWDEIKE